MLLINLGCGLHAPAGWINVDRSPSLLLDRVRIVKPFLHRIGLLKDEHMVAWPRNIIMADVRRGLPSEPGSVDAIYSSHMLEHMYLNEARCVLSHCHAALKPDGILRLALPNALAMAESLVHNADSEASWRFNEALLAYPLTAPTRRDLLRAYFASPPHRWQPTPSLAVELLIAAGFKDVSERSFGEGNMPRLAEVEHRPSSFFVEAWR